MSDNGEKLQQEDQYPKVIFTAELNKDKQVEVKVYSTYLPILAYALKLLETEVDRLFINEKIKNTVQQNKIIKPKHGIMDFVRKRY